MRIVRTRDYEDMSRKAANVISAQIILKPNCILGLATGSTPIGTYTQLAEWNKKGDLDFSQVSTYNLDEYRGLSHEDPQSYHYFMKLALSMTLLLLRQDILIFSFLVLVIMVILALMNQTIISLRVRIALILLRALFRQIVVCLTAWRTSLDRRIPWEYRPLCLLVVFWLLQTVRIRLRPSTTCVTALSHLSVLHPSCSSIPTALLLLTRQHFLSVLLSRRVFPKGNCE